MSSNMLVFCKIVLAFIVAALASVERIQGQVHGAVLDVEPAALQITANGKVEPTAVHSVPETLTSSMLQITASGKIEPTAVHSVPETLTSSMLRSRMAAPQQGESFIQAGSGLGLHDQAGAEALLDADLALSARCSAQQKDTKDVQPYHRLAFIHIPRTGGTSIEDCTHNEPNDQDRWGVQSPFLKSLDGQFGCTGQHLPPTVIKKFKAGHDMYYAGHDTFCVVRDPYNRVVSQFGYGGKGESLCTEDELNAFVLKKLSNLREPFIKMDDCHWVPQVAYVMGWDTDLQKVDLSQQSCKHVLRFENLVEDFNTLMQASGYPYRLNSKAGSKGFAANTQSSVACHRLSKTNLTSKSRQLIEDFYQDDFQMLGYVHL